MKKVKYLAMLLAAGMFVACSDNLEDTGAGNAGGTTPATGEGYVKVAINMPTTSGGMSRADDDGTDTGNNDVILDDGVADEYAVKDGIIAFFEANENESDPDANATLVKAYSMSNLNQTDDQTDIQVSTRVTRIQEAPLAATGKKLYALVILNPNNAFIEVTSDDKLSLKTNPEATTVSKLADLQGVLSNQNLTNYTGSDNKDFTMISSPFSIVSGNTSDWSKADTKTLVPVEVYKTQAEAQGSNAAQIYVERIVAKVTLQGFDYSNNKYTLDVAKTDATSIYHGDEIQLDGWLLNVTNKSTYLLRNVDGFSTTSWLTNDNTNKSNFVGIAPIDMGTDQQPCYRIYWAEDPNYNTNYTTANRNEFTIYTVNQGQDNDIKNWYPNTFDAVKNNNERTTDHALYCLENTMDYDMQDQNQTTGILLKTKYIVRFDGETPEATEARSFFVYGDEATKCLWEDVTTSTGEPASTGTIKGLKSLIIEATASMSNKLEASEVSLATTNGGIYTRDNIDELITITKDNVTTDEQKAPYYDAIWSTLRDISFFNNGECYYYDALIQHFGDDTGWTTGNYTLSHLGRYGIVRNNWYDININSVSGPGKPSVEEPGDEPDDKTEGYMRCSINVLSWAKRSQNVEL